MTLEQFASHVLFGTTLEAKLVVCLDPLNSSPVSPIAVPHFPGRPKQLARIGKAKFPSIHRLHDPIERGKVLHFFANHELLAMELMALVLLRFPEAPPSFRQGIARIIQEEQTHLRLYISRMKELGIEFGDLPVNDYFWNTMKNMKSPLDFTTQMSLTFEQANLDFSLFFKDEVAKTGDHLTTEILERVYREEIGHVKHGLVWFNRLRDSDEFESEWEAYVRLLPSPMTPQRAKGLRFSEEARRQAGLSESFIRELRLYSGSKGRPPVLWFYNPQCDSEIARGQPGFTPTSGARKISQDLEHVPMFLGQVDDVVLVDDRPHSQWLESLQQAGFNIPEFVEIRDGLARSIKASKIGGIQPWGWSPDILLNFRPLLDRLVNTSGGNSQFCKKVLSFENFSQTGIGELFSKSWSTGFLREWLKAHPSASSYFGDLSTVGQSFSELDSAFAQIREILVQGYSAMVKAPYGTSGMQVRRIQHLNELEGPVSGWIKNTISNQDKVVIETYLNKIADLSIQIEIHTDRVELLEVRQFYTGRQNEYRGTYLGRKLPGLNPEQLQFFHSILPDWHHFLRDLAIRVREHGYLGPAGIDAMIWKDRDGTLRLKPLVELNPRWTMGRVALELEKHLDSGVNGIWIFIPIRELKKNRIQWLQRRNAFFTRNAAQISASTQICSWGTTNSIWSCLYQ